MINVRLDRHLSFWFPILLIAGLGLLIVSALMNQAHADPVAAGDWQPAAAAQPLPVVDVPTTLAAWIALAIALGMAILRVVAPLTKATWDDRLLDRLERLENVVHGRPTRPQGPPPSTMSGTLTFGLLLIAGGLAIAPACATAERAGGAAKVAALKCGEPQLATAAALVARWAVDDALAGEINWAGHETDALGFGLGIGTCAYAEVRRAYKAKPTVQARGAEQAPDDGQAGLERLRAKLGGVPIELADGTVL